MFAGLAAAGSVAVMLAAGAGVASADGESGGASGESGVTECRNVEVPTTVGGQSGAIAATLCTPPGATSLQILIHGYTYNRGYFDVAVEPETYSYARGAHDAGYATLAIDRLGTGESLHPLSLFTTIEADIRTVHEVVQAARNGEFGTEYDKVMTVGHSLGSAVAQGEAGNYGDVDAVITTGFSSAINYLNAFIEIGGRSHPAVSDEKFADSGLDPLYVTSIPGTRTLFINPDNTDPRLNEYDEAELKDTNSSVENATMATYPFTNASANIDVPVLVVTGTEDPFFCGLNSADCTSSESLLAHERAFYTSGNVVEAFAVPNTGHSIHLERTAPDANERMVEFADTYVGPGEGEQGTEPDERPEPAPTASGTPSPQNQLLDQLFLNAVKPAADAYVELKQPVPGLGDTTNPNPASAETLGQIAAAVSQFAPPATQGLLRN
jgi:pimeloyl-ACP methyl ester carboxylesterase